MHIEVTVGQVPRHVTLNHIWLQDHGAKKVPYQKVEEEDIQMPIAAEDVIKQ